MRKGIAVLILCVLLIGILGACGDGGRAADLAAYRALMEEMEALAEYRILGEMTMDFAGFPMGVLVEGTMSRANAEMVMHYQQLSPGGEPMFAMHVILREETMYMELAPVLDFLLRPVFEMAGIDASDIEMRDILGVYEYMRIPYEGALHEMLFAPAQMEEGFDVEPFLSRDGEVFTLRFQDEEVGWMMGEIDTVLRQFATLSPGGVGIGAEIGAVGSVFDLQDLTGAYMVMVFSRSGDSFYQSMEIELPGMLDTAGQAAPLHIRADFTFTPWTVSPLGAPAHTLTEAELEVFLLQIDFAALLSGGAALPAGEIALVYDLHTLGLIGHVLEEGSLLATAPLGDGAGEEHMVLVIDGANLAGGVFYLVVDADAIELYYTSLDDLDAVEAVLLAVARDQAEYFLPDSTFTYSALRSNEARTMAALAIAEETAAGMVRVSIYLAQNIGGSRDVILMELVIYMDLLLDMDRAILTELGQHIGVSLDAYIAELTGMAG